MTDALIIAAFPVGLIIGAVTVALLSRPGRLERLLEAHDRDEADLEALADATREPPQRSDEQIDLLFREVRKHTGEADPNRDPATALMYACPFCSAQPGEPCVSKHGHRLTQLPLPHYSRTPEGGGHGGPR